MTAPTPAEIEAMANKLIEDENLDDADIVRASEMLRAIARKAPAEIEAMAERLEAYAEPLTADDDFQTPQDAAAMLRSLARQALAPSSWECGARKQGTAGGNDPADCDWPVCGCDPYASKVIASLEERGSLPTSPAAPSPGWKPIETAPKDGTKILGAAGGRVEIVAHAQHKTARAPWRENYSLGSICFHQPTHWMPLPEPPPAARAKTWNEEANEMLDDAARAALSAPGDAK